MTTDPEEVVTAFCAPWATPDPEEILGWFTEDAVYHDIPMPPAEGRAAIEEFLGAVRDGRIAAWRDYFDLATVTAAFS
jgi:limonene-1,2-epoxide hydrolase